MRRARLTFYYASYACIAEEEDLILITEDTELLKKCKYAMRAKDVESHLNLFDKIWSLERALLPRPAAYEAAALLG